MQQFSIEDIVSQAIVKLYESERFYAEILLQMDRYISKSVPTAGVRIKNKIELFINPDFFREQSLPGRVAILKHECEHILRDHISRAKEISPEIYAKKHISKEKMTDDDWADNIINNQKHKIMNIAMDCGINCQIKDIPEWGVFPKQFDLKDDETFEWYLENLKGNKKAEDLMEYDGHPIWAESDGDKEELKHKIKQAINKAAAKTKAAGMLTHDQELLVSRLNKSTKNWKQELRRFTAKQIDTVLETSRKRRNRRYGIKEPGHVKVERLTLGVALDTSGSISDEALNQFMAEVRKIAQYCKVMVVEADCEVKSAYEFDPKKDYSVKGRGGTAYQPALDYFSKEVQVDAVVYFGDMDTSDEEIKKPKYPVLWAIVGHQQPPAPFGSKISISVAD